MMMHRQVLLIAALMAAAILSASTANAANETKKKSFSNLLTASASVASTSNSPASVVSAEGTPASRATSLSQGIHAATPRPPGLSFAAYRAIVYQQLVQNRNNLFAALNSYQSGLRSGTLTNTVFNASRLNAIHIFTGYKAGLLSEYNTGTPYYFLNQVGLGPAAIQPGALFVSSANPQVVPPLTSIK